jgi:hypothetical protein
MTVFLLNPMPVTERRALLSSRRVQIKYQAVVHGVVLTNGDLQTTHLAPLIGQSLFSDLSNLF